MLTVEKKGTLCFWGDWFGRPMDNIHTVVKCEQLERQCVLHFSDGEVCTISDPAGIVSTPREFHNKDASQIRWEWYLYGKQMIEKNKRTILYEKRSRIEVVKNGMKSINPQGHYAFVIA